MLHLTLALYKANVGVVTNINDYQRVIKSSRTINKKKVHKVDINEPVLFYII